MKICILTQPLHTNYGGLLQAYALQTVLKRMGHDVLTENRNDAKRKLSIIDRIKRIRILRIITGKSKYPSPTFDELQILTRNTGRFVKQYICTTSVADNNPVSLSEKYHFDAYVVGSDQVWRPFYSPYLQHYFLDFIEGQDVKRIAYSASFGTDVWELTPRQTTECAALLKQFDAVSVREDSAVGLCKKYFGVDAIHLLDPTMLLEKDDYISLAEVENEPHHDGTVMTYFLDRNAMKDVIATEVCRKIGGKHFSVSPKSQYSDVGSKGMDDCIFPSVTSWIKGFMDAEYVVTDSFHGTVFSIIFNKPFITIANRERGVSRFTSLLKMFGLEGRLIYSLDDFNVNLIDSEIDFEKVNMVRKSEQSKAFSFFASSLCSINKM